MSLELRAATPADVETLFAIRTSVVQNHLSREQMAELGITPEALVSILAAEPCAWIAEVDGAAAGFAMVDSEIGEVFALFIRPEFEGLGIGRALLALAEACLFQRHERIWLVTDGNPQVRANGFYQRLGWHQVARVDARDVRFEKQR
ncbi:GNAT family N-acetyltransferase [Pseudomonas sp. zfem002]|uniref:GNAT family N-acetyltransferase n=1 Tax=Pseudomonas sp. zfem002 TaxID=3078197 RepID=UPI0029285BA8|nr:GNAT family N-acetyltransferase [Pseudomonas sp. zfem002]MDU9393574.1 GNAT family N-acetyltransferase [Pseudomonas sp. zfem002]